MARNKEALVLVLDVGPSMHSVLPEIEKVCSMLVQKKLIYNKYDEVGVVLFGTEDTNNELTTEVGGYQHVVVLQNTKVVDGDIVEALQQLPRGTTDGDFLDAIIVGMDMLVKKVGKTSKVKKCLCLFTNAKCPIKESNQGTKEVQVATIAKQMTAHGIKIESIIVRGKLIQDANKEIMDENDRLLNIFSKETSTSLVYVENPVSLFGALKTRKITPVTVFRGDLEISPQISIKVWVYKKTAEEKLPTLKRYSDKAPPNDQFAKHEVKVDYAYKSTEAPYNVVPPDQRIKGYPYGPHIVPISSSEWEAVKFKPEKGVKLLGFTDSSNIYRHHYMKDVYSFLPEPGNTKAMVAASAVARAMKKTNKVAILRCVWRRGQANVIIGVLTPNLSNEENIPDSFYLNVLPFAEDVREYRFPSLSSYPASCQPNEQQLKAAANLIKTLNLAPPGQEEVLQPDFTPNPVLERFYHFLELKSKDPEAAVPPVDATLKKITEPDADLLLKSKSAIDSFCKAFGQQGNPLKKKRHLLPGEGSSSNDEQVKGNITAINEMKNKIFDLVEDSHEGDNYPKALECLAELRKGCILEKEPKQFNDFLKHLHNFCQEKNLQSFCEYLASKELTLISKTEAIDSEVTDDEARSFLVKSEPKVD